jgi:hypothetical protein
VEEIRKNATPSLMSKRKRIGYSGRQLHFHQRFGTFFLTMLIQYLKIGAMKNSSIVTQRVFLIVGLIIATIFVSTPAGAGQDQVTAISGGDLSLSAEPGLRIPLSGLFSLDLNLSSVPTGPSSTGERQWGDPPIPLSKPPGSDLHYTRLGVGFSLRF